LDIRLTVRIIADIVFAGEGISPASNRGITQMYANNDRAAFPANWRWYSVETPSVFREFKLPVDDGHMTSSHKKQLRVLKNLAEIHSTSIKSSAFRRG